MDAIDFCLCLEYLVVMVNVFMSSFLIRKMGNLYFRMVLTKSFFVFFSLARRRHSEFINGPALSVRLFLIIKN